MAQSVVKTWDEVWQKGRAHEMTHWNYSRGKIRFRAILEEPEEIGEEVVLDDSEKIRVRFYTIVNDEYVENDELDIWLKPPKEQSLDVPDDFDEWDTDAQKKYIGVAMERISAGRYSRQMEQSEKLLHRFIDHLTKTLDKKEKLIGELYAEINKMAASRGIANMWEFLVHPNANQIVHTIVTALGSGKITPVEVVNEARRLAAAGDPALPKS